MTRLLLLFGLLVNGILRLVNGIFALVKSFNPDVQDQISGLIPFNLWVGA